MSNSQPNDISERELEILKLIATGASNKEVAQKLGISANTVKVHLRNIFGKIGAASRTEAAMYAVRLGLVETPLTTGAVINEEEETSGIEEDKPVPGMGAAAAALDPNNLAGSFAQAAGASQPAGSRARQDRRGWWSFALVLVLLSLATMVVMLANRDRFFALPTSSPAADSTNRIQLLAVLPTARTDLALAAYESQIYAIAGKTASGTTGVVEAFDPKEKTWKRLADKPLPVSQIGTAVIGGLIFVPGGLLDSGKPSDAMEVYDPHQDRWERRSSLPKALSAYAITTFEGRLFVFGGWDGAHYLNTVYEYDPERDAWMARTPMPTARAFGGAAEATNKIFVLGGFDGKRALNTDEIYLPDREGTPDNPWIKGPALPEPRYAMGVASVADLVLVIAGKSSQNQVASLSSYQLTPDSNEWSQLTSVFPGSWSGMGLVPFGTQLYAAGGELNGVITAQNLSYKAIYTASIPVVK